MKKSVVRRVLKYIKPYKGLLALAILSAIISVSLTLYIPVLTGNAIDNIIDKGNVNFENVLQIIIYIAVGVAGVHLTANTHRVHNFPYSKILSFALQ